MSVYRDTFYNLITQIGLAALTLWTLPRLVAGLQVEMFGVLTILWAVLGYFSFLDLGIGRAVVKYLSIAVHNGNIDERRQLVWTSLLLVAGAGILAGTILAIGAPWFIPFLLGAQGGHYHDSVYRAVNLIAAGVPFLLLFSIVKSFFLAYKRFDIYNILTGLSGIVQNVGSVLLVWLGEGIESIIFLSVYSKIVLIILAVLSLEHIDKKIILTTPILHRRAFSSLITFGGWVSVSQVISPLFNYVDRFMIGAILPLTFVAYYVVPQEAITRLLIIPMSLSTTLFPILSARATQERLSDDLLPIYHQAMRFMSAALAPISVVLAILSMDILTVWMGRAFAAESAPIFTIIAAGLFFNGMAQIPSTLLQATGHPEIPAKYHLIELPLMICMNVLLIPLYGVIGAAITWLLRVALDFILLHAASDRLITIVQRNKQLARASITKMVPYLILAMMIPLGFIINGIWLVIAVVLIMSMYTASLWFFLFNEADRIFLRNLAIRHRPA